MAFKNRAKQLAYLKKYREKHSAEYYRQHREERLTYGKKYYAEHKTERLAYDKKHYAEHKCHRYNGYTPTMRERDKEKRISLHNNYIKHIIHTQFGIKAKKISSEFIELYRTFIQLKRIKIERFNNRA